MLGRITITQKLSAGFGIVILIIALLVAVTWRSFSATEESSKWNIHTYKVMDLMQDAKLSLINIETGMRGFLLAGRDDFLDPTVSGKQSFDQNLAELKRLTSDNPRQQQRLEELRKFYTDWITADVDGMIALRRTNPSEGVMTARVAEARGKAKMDRMRQILNEAQADEDKLLADRQQAFIDQQSTALKTLLIGGALAALIGITVAIALSASIKRRLTQAIQVASAIAAGRLDGTIDAGKQDEIGSLLTALSDMQTQLHQMILGIKSGAQQLLETSSSVAAASSQLAVAARDQSQSAGSMAAAVEELTVSISHVASNATEAHGISTDSGKQSVEGGNVLKRTLVSVEEIASTVQSSAADANELGRSIGEISTIVNVIKSIADQTNLLALNAAIEAARAGEHGPGFAVVADEVRQLAQRTASATHEIGQMIGKVQGSTQRVVQQMAVGLEQANSGLTLAQSAGDVIELIGEGSNRIVSAVDQISAALQQQSAASQDVARSVETIAQMAQTNSDAVDQVSRNASSIKELANSLELQVARFKV
ncbi:methyl-accepting chemotaxis protein [Pigmentiphaga aceris]|uniref:Methyl-accepting chemotaxis protein n=1 Tax=Pigmentiphaga aceris TaxID=1940612 RepID=A0A5C0B296_9BURK|nr:methyl-accepting chemotaxis protein [Pigmentiphaga aceris]QEI08034.1 methyl-accepting chemotaxis protein [Pigmentiphaga aceris]